MNFNRRVSALRLILPHKKLNPSSQGLTSQGLTLMVSSILLMLGCAAHSPPSPIESGPIEKTAETEGVGVVEEPTETSKPKVQSIKKAAPTPKSDQKDQREEKSQKLIKERKVTPLKRDRTLHEAFKTKQVKKKLIQINRMSKWKLTRKDEDEMEEETKRREVEPSPSASAPSKLSGLGVVGVGSGAGLGVGLGVGSGVGSGGGSGSGSAFFSSSSSKSRAKRSLADRTRIGGVRIRVNPDYAQRNTLLPKTSSEVLKSLGAQHQKSLMKVSATLSPFILANPHTDLQERIRSCKQPYDRSNELLMISLSLSLQKLGVKTELIEFKGTDGREVGLILKKSSPKGARRVRVSLSGEGAVWFCPTYQDRPDATPRAVASLQAQLKVSWIKNKTVKPGAKVSSKMHPLFISNSRLIEPISLQGDQINPADLEGAHQRIVASWTQDLLPSLVPCLAKSVKASPKTTSKRSKLFETTALEMAYKPSQKKRTQTLCILSL